MYVVLHQNENNSFFCMKFKFFLDKKKEKAKLYSITPKKYLNICKILQFFSYGYIVYFAVLGGVLHIKNNENKITQYFVLYFNFFNTKKKVNISLHDINTNKKIQHYSVLSHRGNRILHNQKSSKNYVTIKLNQTKIGQYWKIQTNLYR